MKIFIQAAFLTKDGKRLNIWIIASDCEPRKYLACGGSCKCCCAACCVASVVGQHISQIEEKEES